jgi:beta-phosphoglucomutase-like phosphatase (HAD superfamily)
MASSGHRLATVEIAGESLAVVFDSEGVLVDSERLAWQAWRTVLAQHGVDVAAADVRNLTGRTQHDVS